MSAKTPVKGHASKHVHKASKHHKAKGKHHPAHNPNPVPQFRVVPPHAVGKPAHHAKPRGFAVDGLPVCAFEAVAMSLRLAGQRVTDDDVAGLWELYGEVSITEALDAAVRSGLGGQKPCWLPVLHPLATCGLVVADAELGFSPADDALHGLAGYMQQREAFPVGIGPADLRSRDALQPVIGELRGHALILGVDVPGPHAVLATADGWWSWGELFSPWPCRIEEAWAVSWS